MRLLPLAAEDEDLAVRLECDPGLMRHIGGPRPEADVRRAHQRRLELMAQGRARMFKVVAGAPPDVLGTIGAWAIDWKGPNAWEIGWFVLPEHQGKGVATRAAQLLIAHVRADPEVASLYAFPSVENSPSNSMARNLGMHDEGTFDNEGFAGTMRCRAWRLDTGGSGSG